MVGYCSYSGNIFQFLNTFLLNSFGKFHFDMVRPQRGLDQSQAFEGYVTESQYEHRRQLAANWKWLRLSAYLETPRKSDSASFWR